MSKIKEIINVKIHFLIKKFKFKTNKKIKINFNKITVTKLNFK